MRVFEENTVILMSAFDNLIIDSYLATVSGKINGFDFHYRFFLVKLMFVVSSM